MERGEKDVRQRIVCNEALERLNQAELFLFDFDGTLVHFHHDFLLDQALVVNERLEHPPISRERLAEGFRLFDFFHFVEESLFGRDEYIELFWEHFAWDGFPAARIFPGVTETLSHLAEAGRKIALVTSRRESVEQVSKELERCGILQFFSHIEPRTCLESHWSDKKSQIKATCERLGVEPHRAVMVGDVPPDVETAREAGVATLISVLSGGIDPEVLKRSGPHILLQEVQELKELLKIQR